MKTAEEIDAEEQAEQEADQEEKPRSWCDRAINRLGGRCPECGGPISRDWWGMTVRCTGLRCGGMYPDGIWRHWGPRVF